MKMDGVVVDCQRVGRRLFFFGLKLDWPSSRTPTPSFTLSKMRMIAALLVHELYNDVGASRVIPNWGISYMKHIASVLIYLYFLFVLRCMKIEFSKWFIYALPDYNISIIYPPEITRRQPVTNHVG